MVISGKTGKVLSYDIAPSVIASRHRMNYPDVAKILTDRDTALREKYSDIVPMLEPWRNFARSSIKTGETGCD